MLQVGRDILSETKQAYIVLSDFESRILGREKLTSIFGYWPSFHDAEVIDLQFWRGHVDVDAKEYVLPVLTMKIHVWELTATVDPRGKFVLRHHTLATLRFHDVGPFRMDGFNHQNSILSLSISLHERDQGISPFFRVEFEPGFGISASFECNRIEVLNASPCDERGNAGA